MSNALHIVAAYLSNDARVKSYLSVLKSAGWNVDVIAYEENNQPRFEENDGLTIFRASPKYQGKSVYRYLLSYIRFYYRAALLAQKLHKKKHYKFVHVHNMPNVLVGIPLLLKPKTKIILDMHDLMSINYKTKFGNNNLALNMIKLEESWSISKADRILCADKGQKIILKQIYGNINPTVVMNLADSSVFRWQDHSWNSGVFRFVYHGTIARRLGVDRVIEALRFLPKHVVFRLIGDGDEKQHVLRLIDEYDLRDRVEIYPIVRVESLPDLLKDCHAGVIPSRRTEATDRAMLPVKLLEYCALGIPSVVSKLNNIQLHFTDDQLLFFNPESQKELQTAMFDISNSKETRNRILRGLSNFNKKYNWKSVSESYLRIVKDLCEN